jgi:hypothetical protein
MTPEEYVQYMWQASEPARQAYDEFGLGPQYMSGPNMFSRPGQKASYTKNVMGLGGVDIDDMFGFPEAPQRPEEPSFTQNDLGTMYEGNPVVAFVRNAMQNGLDPLGATRLAEQAAADGEFGDGWESFMPTATDSRTNRPEIDWDGLRSIATDIQMNDIKMNRERADYQSQLDEFNRYNQPISEWDRAGQPGVDEYARSLAQQSGVPMSRLGAATHPGGVPAPGVDPRLALPRGFADDPANALGAPAPVGRPRGVMRGGPNMAGDSNGIFRGAPATVEDRVQSSKAARGKGERAVADMLQRGGAKQQELAKNRIVERSPRETEVNQRLMAIASLVMGAPPA